MAYSRDIPKMARQQCDHGLCHKLNHHTSTTTLVGLDHIHVLWLEDVRLLVVYCQLLTSVKLMEVPVKNWICINHYICWITNTRHTLFTYFNTPPYSCIYKLCNTVAVQCRQFTSSLRVLLNLLYTRGERSLWIKGGLPKSFFSKIDPCLQP